QVRGAKRSGNAIQNRRSETLRRLPPAEPSRRCRCGNQRRAVGKQAFDPTREQVLRKARLCKKPTTPSRGKGAGLRGLMVVGRMRVGNENRRAAEGGKFGHSGGSGATDRQMRPAQPYRHIVEE